MTTELKKIKLMYKVRGFFFFFEEKTGDESYVAEYSKPNNFTKCKKVFGLQKSFDKMKQYFFFLNKT